MDKIRSDKKRIVILSNLLPLPWEPNRGAFNRQQFSRLEQHYQCLYLVPVPLLPWLKHNTRTVKTSRAVWRFPAYLYIPKVARAFYGWFLLISIVLHSGLSLLRFKPHLIIASWAHPEGYVGGRLAKFLGIPYLIKVHGSDINELLDHGLRGRQIVQSMQDSSGVISVSQALKNKLVERGVAEDKIQVIYNGVDKELFNPEAVAPTFFHHTTSNNSLDNNLQPGQYLVYVGNLKAGKGIFELLDSFSQIAPGYPQLKLVIIGDGPEETRLKKIVDSSKVGERVLHLPSMPSASIAKWMKSSKALVLPSYNEGVPNVVLEAKACGVPVIATTVGGTAEVFQEGVEGFLVSPRDSKALATAIDKLMQRSWDKQRISANAESFCWKGNIRQLTLMIERSFE